MLSIHNVSKTYVTKSKVETQALKDVSIEIASRGMVFILGKSGSGKSTLLNLLGGLDTPTSGEILLNGKSMSQFTRKDYDAYRNSYVGFIFQEFNLLADFNVRDNVALALRLSKVDNVDEKVSNALKQVELNDEYLNRRIGEMSGGEKQRIAIARAIIKDSKIILADEPTGNLDSATGESIWNILKNLSKTRLVVVVSHDIESAEKYADRIIEIVDGQVATDNGTQPAATEKIQAQQNAPTTDEGKQLTAGKSKLAFATKLKMAFNNLRLRKFKTISTAIMTILCTFAIVITQMFLSFSPEAALADYMTEHNVDYFTVRQGHMDKMGFATHLQAHDPLSESAQKYVEDNCRIVSSTIESKQELLDLGLTFVGNAMELDDNSFYVTSLVLDEAYKEPSSNALVAMGSGYAKITKEKFPVEVLIGRKVRLHLSSGEREGILAGVIDCQSLVNPWALPQIFSNETKCFNDYNGGEHTRFNDDNNNVNLQLGDKQYKPAFTLTDISGMSFRLWSGDGIVTADGIWSKVEDIALADNEIVLSYGMYAKLFNANSQGYYVNSDVDEVRNMPPEIGQTFDFKLFDNDTKELIVDCGKVKIAGIFFSRSSSSHDNDIFVNNNFLKNVAWNFSKMSTGEMIVQVSSVKNLKGFVTTLRSRYLGYIDHAGIVEAKQYHGSSWDGHVAFWIYGLEETLIFISIVLLVICAILVTILVLLAINLISFSVASRKREIGILSAIGASNGDVTGIFLLETAIIAAIGFVVTFAMSFIAPPVFNVQWNQKSNLVATFTPINVNILTIVTLILSSFGLLLLATLLPLRKIIKQKPVDAIRNV